MVFRMEVRLFERVDDLRSPLAAATHVHLQRRHLFVEIEVGPHSGWGEVTPLAEPLNGDPGYAQVRRSLESTVLPTLVDLFHREGVLPAWSRAHLLGPGPSAAGWAWAAVEMALLDLALVEAGTSLDELWDVRADCVPEMATTSALAFDAGWTPPATASRVRLKTAPGVELGPIVPVLAAWARPVLLDFNASADSFATVRAQVGQLASSVEVVAVEQPFPPGDLASHALLADSLEVPVGLDESVRTVLDVRRIARYRAARLVCVKPPRVGGLAVARSMLSEAAELGLRAYVGGFFDTPLARRAGAAVAAGFTLEPCDVGAVAFAAPGPVGAPRSRGIGFVPSPQGLVRLASFQLL
jgi:O-succinylbenzoate synthase